MEDPTRIEWLGGKEERTEDRSEENMGIEDRKEGKERKRRWERRMRRGE